MSAANTSPVSRRCEHCGRVVLIANGNEMCVWRTCARFGVAVDDAHQAGDLRKRERQAPEVTP